MGSKPGTMMRGLCPARFKRQTCVVIVRLGSHETVRCAINLDTVKTTYHIPKTAKHKVNSVVRCFNRACDAAESGAR